MTTTAPKQTAPTLTISCENVYEAAILVKLWDWLGEERGHTIKTLNDHIYHSAGSFLERLSKIETKGLHNPIYSKIAGGSETRYMRDKEWHLEIVIENPSVQQCTIVLARPQKRRAKKPTKNE